MYGWDWGWGMWIAGTLMMLLWVAIATLVIVAIVRAVSPRPPQSDALAILQQRLARGEIDAEQYRATKEAIGR